MLLKVHFRYKYVAISVVFVNITKIKVNNFYPVLHDQILTEILLQLTKPIFIQYRGGGHLPPPPTHPHDSSYAMLCVYGFALPKF
jgi:hypothetical protein